MLTFTVLAAKRALFSLLAVSLTMALASCSNLPNTTEPDTKPIYNQHTNSQNSVTDNVTDSIINSVTKCPPYNPEQNMCTAQYDPVCVTIKKGTTLSYRTAGNACSACSTTAAISYTKGQCL